VKDRRGFNSLTNSLASGPPDQRRIETVRKTLIDPATVHSEMRIKQEWLDLEEVAKVEVTSEDPSFPVESALVSGKGPGWRASQRGKQIIRIIFDKPTRLRRIRLEFLEMEIAWTQELTLQWSAEPGGPFSEVVRQQWEFQSARLDK